MNDPNAPNLLNNYDPAELERCIQIDDSLELDNKLLKLPQSIKKEIIHKNLIVSLATYAPYINCIKILVKHGADVNELSNEHTEELCTPLNYACLMYSMNVHVEIRRRYLETAKFLVESGSDCNIPGEFGRTALEHIAGHQKQDNDILERKEFIQLLVNHGADTSVIEQEDMSLAACMGCVEIYNFVRNCQPDIADTKGYIDDTCEF